MGGAAIDKSKLSAESIFRVDGLVAVITGGGTGIGLTMAKSLSANGASKVYILGRRLSALQSASQSAPNLIPIQCDVTSYSSLQSAVDKITAETGYINLLICNAGVADPASKNFDPTLSLKENRERMLTPEAMEGMNRTFETNVTGAYYTMVAFLDLLEEGNKRALRGGWGKPEREGGDVLSVQSQVIFTASIAAYSRHAASGPAYAGSKAAVVQLVKQASSGLARYGLRVNAIAPGLFPSELAQGLTGGRDPSTEGPDHPLFIPARRFGVEEEIAGAILYLASKAGAFCNGSILMFDGGRLSVMVGSY